VAAAAFGWPSARSADPPLPTLPTPEVPPPYPLPPLPGRSPRNASYSIDVRLDPERHTLLGRLELEWRNDGPEAVSTFPFHLYWNAFRNTGSTTAREGGSRGAPPGHGQDARRFGYAQVKSVRLASGADLTPTMRYVQPDDGNPDDRTVMEVQTPEPVPPGQTARFAIEWSALIPHGSAGRAGWVHDYNFMVQWFPKVGAFRNGQWNRHQFHAWSEFFADYGVYDVRITVPEGFVLGATGRREGEPFRNADGTVTHRYVQEDVHDFAWTASRRFLEKKDRFADPGYPPVEIRLLVQPEHEHLSARYLEATKAALRHYGAWSAPYPYAQITVVDPAWTSSSGGMEYPTLFTGGARIFSPPALQSPESVTVHEAGHQFWYGLVGTNEFEEAWLDEGFNQYHEAKTTAAWLGPVGVGRYYFGPAGGRGSRTGFPVVAPGVLYGRGFDELPGLRRNGKTDEMARRSWEYRNRPSYGLNSYGKPALSLQTLEGLIGEPAMTRVLRTYAHGARFAHPTSADFIAAVNEVTGRDYRWFFEETWYSSNLCDYAVAVSNRKRRTLEGYRESDGGGLELVPPGQGREEADDAEVVIERRGEVRLPVELRVVFADGGTAAESWDGRYRWTRFRYPGRKVVRADVDPDGKIALDVDPANNGWVEDKGEARRAAGKWAARYLFWLQNLLELHLVVG
jgi:hypothetical protein